LFTKGGTKWNLKKTVKGTVPKTRIGKTKAEKARGNEGKSTGNGPNTNLSQLNGGPEYYKGSERNFGGKNQTSKKKILELGPGKIGGTATLLK